MAAAVAVAVARKDSEVRGARGSGWGRLGLRLRLLQRRPRSSALYLLGPPRSAVRASAVCPPAPFPEPAVMGAARGAPSSPRRLPVLSVLLLQLLSGESRRAGGAGLGERVSLASTRGHRGNGFGRLERGRHPGVVERLVRGPGSREVAKPSRTLSGPVSHPRPRGRVASLHRVFPV